jgi:hypothetical protein
MHIPVFGGVDREGAGNMRRLGAAMVRALRQQLRWLRLAWWRPQRFEGKGRPCARPVVNTHEM